MERCSLWRRRSSEKGSGETESSVSISSERLSDHQDVAGRPSPETIPDLTTCEHHENTIKMLTRKLANALSKIHDKEELVKQHIRVAEEAVSGWEKAEAQVLRLKQQLNAATQKNAILKEKINHLETALKESIKQHSHIRWEQELKLHDVPVEKSLGCSTNKIKIHSQEDQLEYQLEAVGSEPSMDHEIQKKLEKAEKENSELKHELLVVSEQLRLQTLDAEYGVQAAEMASKLHLESIRKVARLEAQCHRLQATINRTLTCSQNPLVYMSDGSEKKPCTGNRPTPAMIPHNDQFSDWGNSGYSQELDLLDDFLQMEKFAALPEEGYNEQGSQIVASTNQNGIESGMSGNSEQEDLLNETPQILEMSSGKPKGAQELLEQEQEQEQELDSDYALQHVSESVAVDVDAKRESLEARLVTANSEVEQLSERVILLEHKLENERALAEEFAMRCRKLEEDTSKKVETDFQRAAIVIGNLKFNQEKELAIASKKLTECQKTIASLGQKLASLRTFEAFTLDEKTENRESSSQQVQIKGIAQ